MIELYKWIRVVFFLRIFCSNLALFAFSASAKPIYGLFNNLAHWKLTNIWQVVWQLLLLNIIVRKLMYTDISLWNKTWNYFLLRITAVKDFFYFTACMDCCFIRKFLYVKYQHCWVCTKLMNCIHIQFFFF